MTAVTMLGTGLMGGGMVRNLAAAGFPVTVWNRTPEKARALGDVATVADAPEDAVAGADVVVTMLFDTDAVEKVMERALPAMRGEAVWVQASTVGLEGTARLAGIAGGHGTAFVDAPVLGTKKPAEQGTLTVLAAGAENLRDTVSPVFDAIGSRTIWVGTEPGDAHRLKLAANAWVLTVTTASAQSIALAEALGLDPQQFLDVVSGGPLDCAYLQMKGASMIRGEYEPAFTLSGAAKDTGLIAEAMRASGTDDRLMRAAHEQFRSAADAGHGGEDMAAVRYGYDRRRTGS